MGRAGRVSAPREFLERGRDGGGGDYQQSGRERCVNVAVTKLQKETDGGKSRDDIKAAVQHQLVAVN